MWRAGESGHFHRYATVNIMRHNTRGVCMFRQIALSVSLFVGLTSLSFVPPASFVNPLFTGQDPWVTFVNGVYYYTESYCGIADICVKQSSTLTGLANAPWIGVWSHAQNSDPNGSEIWAPELHYINGGWYIYYAAD